MCLLLFRSIWFAIFCGCFPANVFFLYQTEHLRRNFSFALDANAIVINVLYLSVSHLAIIFKIPKWDECLIYLRWKPTKWYHSFSWLCSNIYFSRFSHIFIEIFIYVHQHLVCVLFLFFPTQKKKEILINLLSKRCAYFRLAFANVQMI